MSEADRPSDHLLTALEELLRAGVAATNRVRRSRSIAELVELWIRRQPEGVEKLAAALDAEAARWDPLADDDPAARRVRDVMLALRDVLVPAEEPPPDRSSAPPSPPPRRRAPRRGSQ